MTRRSRHRPHRHRRLLFRLALLFALAFGGAGFLFFLRHDPGLRDREAAAAARRAMEEGDLDRARELPSKTGAARCRADTGVEAAATALLRIRPADETGLVLRAAVRRDRGEIDGARRDARALGRLAAGSPRARKVLRDLLSAREDPAEACPSGAVRRR